MQKTLANKTKRTPAESLTHPTQSTAKAPKLPSKCPQSERNLLITPKNRLTSTTTAATAKEEETRLQATNYKRCMLHNPPILKTYPKVV